MADEHGETWGGLFAELVQNILDKLEEGHLEALSEFMHNESTRILGQVETLRVPGGVP